MSSFCWKKRKNENNDETVEVVVHDTATNEIVLTPQEAKKAKEYIEAVEKCAEGGCVIRDVIRIAESRSFAPRNVAKVDEFNRSALLFLVELDDEGDDFNMLFDILVEHDNDVDKTDQNGNTTLMLAAEKGRLTLVKLLLGKGAVASRKNKSNEDAPLHFAARKGNAKVVQKLLKHGASANIQNKIRETPLHHAVKREHRQTVQLLLNSKADPDHEDHEGYSPKQRASAAILSILNREEKVPVWSLGEEVVADSGEQALQDLPEGQNITVNQTINVQFNAELSGNAMAAIGENARFERMVVQENPLPQSSEARQAIEERSRYEGATAPVEPPTAPLEPP